MKNSLRRFTFAPLLGLATAALLAGGVWYVLNSQVSWWTPTAKPPADEATIALKGQPKKSKTVLASKTTRRDTSGNSVLIEAIVAIERRAQISAEVQQQAHVGELTIIGSGDYYQQGRGEQRKIKWELRNELGGERAGLEQLVDDRFLWIDQRLPSKRTVERVDLWELRRQFKGKESEFQNIVPGQATVLSGAPNFGGLPMLLESLSRNFDFAAPRLFRYGSEEVYALHGVWKPAKLRELLRSPMTEISDETEVEIPPRMPFDVLLLLGSRDYFPFMIEYRSATDPIVAAIDTPNFLFQESQRPLMRLKLSRVSFTTPIDPDKFVFNRPSTWTDATPRYADRLRRYRDEKLAAEKAKKKG